MKVMYGIVAIIAIAVSLEVQAQLNRSAVSVTGIDTNPCTPAAPCRSLGQALSQTNSGGELIVLTSGGYGPVTVDRSVSIIAAPGIYAGITVPAFTDAVTISLPSPGRVVLRGLALEGLGWGGNGIVFASGGGKLYVERCTINGFVYRGILTFFATIVSDTTIRSGGSSSSSDAFLVDNAGAPVTAIVDNVRLIDNSNGLHAFRNATVIVRNTASIRSRNYGFSVTSGSILNLDGCAATGVQLAGVAASGAGTMMRVSNCTSTDNQWGLRANYGATMETWQNNAARGNSVADIDNTFPVAGTITPVPMN